MDNQPGFPPHASPSARRPRSSGRILVFAVVALLVFLLMRGQQGPEDGRSDVDPQPGGAAGRSVADPDRSGESQAGGDWSLEERSVTSGEGGVVSKSGTQSSTGDWSISEVETGGGGGDATTGTGQPKKTTKGDWTIEEVDTNNPRLRQSQGPKPGSQNAGSKKDWQIEIK